MKSNYKYSLIVLTALTVLSAMFTRCTKNEMGTPSISYIRVTDPAKSDSLVTDANQGQMIAIMGQNLGSVTQAWFNDQQAQLIPSYITNTTIITKVPTQIPTVITDKLKLVFSNGSSLEYDFSVDVSKPVIDHVRSEYVNTGDSLFIYGNYFYQPLTVTLGGGVQAQILSISSDNTGVVVKMPSGVQPGPMTITTNFGVKTSNFWIQDNRNVILDFEETASGLWHPGGGDPASFVPSFSGITSINGNYMLVNSNYATWAWSEILTGQLGAPALAPLKNIPQDAFANPKGYSLKFEINALASTAGAVFFIYMGPNMAGCPNRGNDSSGHNPYLYTWKPNVSTHGVWQTYTIPWSDFYLANNSFPYNSNGYEISWVCQGPNAVTLKFAVDNVRVVPN
jgi:hypothetical protein